MKEIIGQTAGKIWATLNENEAVSLSQLPKIVDEKQAIVYQSLGWLAREDKIEYVTRGKATMVALQR
ncbi:MAG: winged helix-turn-helix domain-containing protein [Candidatus Zixiibacteriota bacterium]